MRDAELLVAPQMLVNLLTNAVKFTAPGGRIDVRCLRTGPTVSIHVSDSGRGIAAEQLLRIFDPFVQIDRMSTATSLLRRSKPTPRTGSRCS